MANQSFTVNIKALFDASDVKAKVGDIQSTLSKLKLPDKLAADLNKSFTNVNKALDDFTSRTEKGIKTKTDATGITKSFDTVTKELTNLDNLLIKVKSQLGDGVDLTKIIKIPDDAKNRIAELQKEIDALQKKINEINVSKLKTLEDALAKVKTKGSAEHGQFALDLFKQGDIDGAIAELDKFIEKLKTFKQTANVTESITALEQMKTAMVAARNESADAYADITSKTQEQVQIAGNAVAEVTNKLNDQTSAFHETSTAASGLTGKMNDLTSSQAQFVHEVDQVKSRIQYFFGLANSINLVKRAIRGAVDTVKELDAAMTETAVVTDHTVSDMWAKLPEYTKRANELGVSTLAAYQSATLYYQQGLNDEQAAALSTETLKMARIAGLEAADATDRMTNALRGFNMELNSTDAQRVDDVYSQLAAMSASNVDEISTAMTKVASLAHSANMEFETTAAFLAQIIETTRESAETAGTALKTVVARFSEVKKLVDTDQLKGTDEEGQVVDVNKVSTALRTAGIDLNKYFLGEVGLDDIFMELASKWDSLTSVQQRYIATQAAGSRQQSRFIALMQDYARTQQLVSAAYNANGASAKQFEKTQESLQSKLARLKNAWDAFLMGLANNAIIKGAVDLLTLLLNTVNNLTSAFGTGIGTILKWVAAVSSFIGLKSAFGASGIASKAIGGLLSDNPLGNKIRASLGQGIFDEATGGFTPYTKEQMGTRTRIFGTNGLFSDLRTNISKFKEKNAAYIPWGEEARLADIAGGGSGIGTERIIPKTLFGALGNKFKGTKVGSGMQEDLSKLPGIGSAFSGDAAGAATLGVALAGVAAAAGLVYAAWRASPQGQLKTAQKQAEKARKEAQEAQNELKTLTTLQDTYKEKTEEVDKALTVQDRKKAIEDRNQAIFDAIKEDGTLAQYVITEQVDNEIVLTIDEEALEKALDRVSEKAEKAAIASNFADAKVGLKEANVAETKLRSMLISASGTTAREFDEMSAQQLYEAIVNQAGVAFSNEQVQKATELYQTYTTGMGTAKQQAALGYGRELSLLGVKDELANALIPVLSTLYEKTGKEFSKEILSDVIKQQNLIPILDAINGKGKIKEISLSGVDIENESEVLEALGISTNALEDFATALGINTKDIYRQIKASTKYQKNIQQTQQKDIFKQVALSGLTINESFFKQIKNLGPEITAQISDVITNAEQAMSKEGFASLVSQMIGSADSAEIKQIQDFYNNFNLDTPIQAFHQLKQAKEEAVEGSMFANMLADIETTNAAIFDTGNLLQNFLTSTSYDDLTDSIEKFIKANGRVTSENIEELVDSCSELQYLLEDTEITVQGLAEAFTLLENGQISIDAITSSLIAALSAGESFEGLMDKVSAWIKNFDEGIDLTEGTQHITDVASKALKYIENWQFGNQPLQNIYDHLFGEGAYTDFMKTNWGRPFDQLEQELGGQIQRIVSLAENDGLGALQELNGKLGIVSQDGLNFNWNLKDQFESTTDAIQAVAKELGVTDDAARAFIESWASHMWDLGQEWNDLNFKDQIKAFSDDLTAGVAITEAELDALRKSSGKTRDEILAAIQAIKGEGYIPIVVDWKDSKGAALNGQSLFDAFDQQFKTFNPQSLTKDFSSILQGIVDGADINADALMQKLTSQLKMTPSQATEVADHIASETSGKLTKDIEVPVTAELKDGSLVVTSETIHIEADSMSELTTAADTAMELAKVEIIAQALAEAGYDGFTNALSTAIGNSAPAGIESIQTQLSEASFTATVTLNAEKGTGWDITKAATGGVVKSYAKGSENFHVDAGTALTGEEGPELVWNKDGKYAYVTGQDGPEFANLHPGDRIFNASETKRIFANSRANGGLIDSFASGGWKPAASKSGGGGGGGSRGGGGGGSDREKTPEEWKNELDWLYNLMEDIVELERDQKAIEEQYEDLLQDQTKTGGDLYRLLVKQLGNLYTQLNHQTFALEKREQEMREFMDTTNDKDQYLWYNWQDRTLEIDWDAIDRITDEEEYKHVKELVDEAEEIQDKIDDADDAIMDITNQIQELENIWRDTFVDFENRVLDAIVKSYQQVIDNYSELNDTLNNSNTQILDSLQKQISLERQIRDNTKTEEEISDEEARLAYLRRDTSGGNDLAALQLERELTDQRENYEDSLVDQAISRLQEDNDAAAQQREKQIEIMQAQLDYQAENGEFNAYISELLTTAMGADGELLTNSDLVALLKEQENWNAMSDVSKEVWDEELNGTFKEVAAFLLKQNAEENGTFYTALTEAVKTVSTTIGSYSQAMTKLGNQIASAASSGYGGGGGSGGGGGGFDDAAYLRDGNGSDKTYKPAQTYTVGGNTYHSREVQVGAGSVKFTPLATAYVPTSVPGAVSGVLKYKKYATGGLAGSTGLAWLDGTPQEPEYVLNARQTDAFLKLADVLPSMMNGTSATTSNTFGATYVNLSVNLESVSPDYDVDRMVDLVKDKLYDAGSYRNVNSLSFLR